MEMHFVLADEAATIRFGQQLSRCLKAPMVVYLQGELGAGKTTLVRALVQELGHSGSVKSPTYTLVEEYDFSEMALFHFDLYRIRDLDELMNMGLSDYVSNRSVCLIEWPEMLKGVLPADLTIELKVLDQARELSLFTACADIEQKLKQCVF